MPHLSSAHPGNREPERSLLWGFRLLVRLELELAAGRCGERAGGVPLPQEELQGITLCFCLL